MLRNRWADPADLKRCILSSRRRTAWWLFFGPIVLSQSLLMVAGKPKMLEGSAIRTQLVSRHRLRRKALLAEQLAHELEGRPFVPSALDQDFENLAFMVDGTPEIHAYTGDPDHQASGAGQLHPRALSEPDVILSHHPAPIVRPRP